MPTPRGRRPPAGRAAAGRAATSGMNGEVCLGRRVDLVGEAVDRRRAVRGQDRQPDRHADHPGDGHDRRRGPERPPAGRLDRGRRPGRHRQPESETERAERQGDRLDRGLGRPARPCAASPPMLNASPTSVTRRSDRTRTARPESERAEGGRAGKGAEGEPLLVGSAVEDPVDEDRPADDRRRERVAGQQRDERGGGEGPDAGTAAGRGTGRATRSPRTTKIMVRSAAAASSPAVTATGSTPLPAISVVPISVSPTRAGEQRRARTRTHPTTSTRPARRGVSQPADAGPAEDQGDQPDRDVDEEDPAPGRAPTGPATSRRVRHPRGRPRHGPTRGCAAPTNGPGRHPEERQRADDARAHAAESLRRTGGRPRPSRPERARRHRPPG